MSRKINMKRFGQPYTDEATMAEFLFPSRTSVELQDATDSINTENKVVGRMVFDTTTSLPAFAAGPGATDVWVSADITVGVDLTPS